MKSIITPHVTLLSSYLYSLHGQEAGFYAVYGFIYYIYVRVRHLRLFCVCETTTMLDFQVWNFLLP